MTITTEPKIRAFTGVKKLKDGVLGPVLDSSVKGLTANAAIYNRLPVDLPVFQQSVAAYVGSIPAARDGSKIAVAQKNKLRATATDQYIQLAHYVEAACNGEMATFLLSGFQAVSTSRKIASPKSKSIRKVVHGANSGQAELTLMSHRGATSYGVQWAAVPPGGIPRPWMSQAVAGIRPATTISGLTPGTVYAFQARALTRDGFTDWSDSVTMMVI